MQICSMNVTLYQKNISLSKNMFVEAENKQQVYVYNLNINILYSTIIATLCSLISYIVLLLNMICFIVMRYFPTHCALARCGRVNPPK